jgi:predicted Zn-dependent peptidase
MSDIAKDEIYFGGAVALEEVIRAIRAVTRDDLVELAAALLGPETMALTLLANIEKKKLDLDLRSGV